jgi:similar to spore coat protein
LSFMDNIFGSDKTLQDQDVVADMLKDSKYSVTSLCSAATEAIDPKLRSMLRGQLEATVNEHFQLTDMAISKGWYKAYASADNQLRDAYHQSQKLT